jgi:hypothetical protein
MLRKKQIPLLLVFVLLLSQMILIKTDNQVTTKQVESYENQIIASPNTMPVLGNSYSTEASDNKSWTYMLYLDADNDIEGDAIRDFEWLEEAGGSDENISIVVLLDRIPGYDNTHGNWNGSRIYNVTADASSTTFESQLMVDLGEVDMADPTTLTDFIIYCFEHFPADNYILDLWNHGHAAYGVIDDETSMSHFIVNDVQTAVTNALAASSEEIDIISMDACDMNTIEVAWEMRNLCKYFLATEDGTMGYPYKLIIEGLKSNPEMSASALCELMVDMYSIHYRYTYNNCLSAINQTKLLDLPVVFNSFITELIAVLDAGFFDEIFAFCRDLSLEFYDGNWIDLVNFIENLVFFLDQPALNLEGVELLEILDQIIACNWQHHSYDGNANGLTIFMPYGSFEYVFYDEYRNRLGFCTGMDWQIDTLWDEFLQYYRTNHLYLVSVEPQLLSVDEVITDCSIVQDSVQLFRINLWQKSIYEFICPISSGDVDFKVLTYDYAGEYEVIGGSYLVNPDDGTTEKCRFRLETGFYLIVVYGIATSSDYEFVVKESEPINLVCNSPTSQHSGSINGDAQGHYKQHVNHYYQIDVPYGNNTITLKNSEAINCQLTIFNELWMNLHFLPAEGFGEILTLIFNQTDENPTTLNLEICCIEGVGDFTIEINNPNEPTPTVSLHYLLILLYLPITIILKKRKKC